MNGSQDNGEARATQPGDVVQINEVHGRGGWIGAFVMVEEVKAWGIQGFVHHIETHDNHGRMYIRLKWEEIEFIGKAALVPVDVRAKQQEEAGGGDTSGAS